MNQTTERQRDAERTRAELLVEATAAFAESGYSGTRVDEIAERTRTTKRMIYYYFGGKEQLYLAVLENAYRGIREAERELQVDGLEPAEAVRRLAELTYDHHLAHGDFIRLVAIENIHHGRFIKQLDSLREVNKPALGLLEDVLGRGKARGIFRDDVDPLEVHLLISSYCVFQVANQHTFGFLFGVDLHDSARRDRLRGMIGDVVVAWLTAPTGAAGH
ncbi:TetR/AcrR family transcriptional regulator [Leucobacter celer]|uniref:TetR/AcrR family transcriptional regulator n=1 Tax=Leucobacter celer TaxID=668625 RepID=UPI0006A79526|nr:TetR/AcrR family transcriptional regulator [Leucobacter celer]